LAGGRSYLLHRIWQKTGRLPSELLKLTPGELAFLYASEEIVIEQERSGPAAQK